jgi:hypothetical protein
MDVSAAAGKRERTANRFCSFAVIFLTKLRNLGAPSGLSVGWWTQGAGGSKVKTMSRNDEGRRDRNDAADTRQRQNDIRRPYDSSQLDRVPRPPDLNTPYGAWWVIE